ncbi:MAG: hypothetical protein L3J52_06120 [Proteobacteria bacterium]|nr:hypothetical protein [Pseudomonadota bacterium]
MKKYPLTTMLMVVLALNINASELTIPNTFTANTPAVAAQVNANFAAVEVSVDDNDSRLDALEALVTQLQTDLATANSTISTLQTDLTTANSNINTLQADLSNVENNTVLQLDGFLQLTVVEGNDTAEFSGLNVQVNDGSGDTAGTVNGLGNLIIGYGEDSGSAPFFCSSPQYTDSLSCTSNFGIWDNNVRTGSHNLVVGFGHSYTKYGSIVLSERNVSNGIGTFVAGFRNIASGFSSSVSGGQNNSAAGTYSSVSGGWSNGADGNSSSVSGGQNNSAGGTYSSVSGGWSNGADGNSSSISGGQNNSADGTYSSVSGGFVRTAAGDWDWVAGSLIEDF